MANVAMMNAYGARVQEFVNFRMPKDLNLVTTYLQFKYCLTLPYLLLMALYQLNRDGISVLCYSKQTSTFE